MTHPASLFCIPALILSFLSPMTAYLFFIHFVAGAALAAAIALGFAIYVLQERLQEEIAERVARQKYDRELRIATNRGAKVHEAIEDMIAKK